MTRPRIEAAEAFLQEAVFRSRARQASLAGLAGQSPDDKSAIGQCGLGKEAAVELDLSPKGAELSNELWDAPLSDECLTRVRDVMRTWVLRSDALDRDRNHFLKAFRRAHGFDRRAYSAEELAAYERGLEEINAGVDRERREHAQRLLESSAQ